MEDVTLVITSCGRPDLLEITIDSFLKQNSYTIKDAILIDDSVDTKMHRHLKTRYGSDFLLLLNEAKLGQIKSIDKAYAEVKSPWVFHCEDDWLFYRPGFIEDSFKVMSKNPTLSQVWLRNFWEVRTYKIRREIAKTEEGVWYREICPNEDDNWYGFSFNPALNRFKAYQSLGAYEAIGHEREIGEAYYAKGWRVAFLEAGAIDHIGWERHVRDPQDHRIPPLRLSRKLKKLLEMFIPPIIGKTLRIIRHQIGGYATK